jgi:hypothetical protein
MSKLINGKSILVAAALGGFLLFTGAPATRAQDHDRDRQCEQRIHKAEAKLQKEIERHGEQSRQAEKRRHELEQVRQSCHRDHDHDHDNDRH